MRGKAQAQLQTVNKHWLGLHLTSYYCLHGGQFNLILRVKAIHVLVLKLVFSERLDDCVVGFKKVYGVSIKIVHLVTNLEVIVSCACAFMEGLKRSPVAHTQTLHTFLLSN